VKHLILLLLIPTLSFSQLYTEKDKQLHFFAGNISGGLGYHLSYQKHQDKQRALITGICTAFAAGVMKEMFDASRGGYIEHADILATTLGGITITTTIPLFQNKKRFKQRKRRPKNRKRKCGI
jgi:hypothetical protein|tara:strand:- start:2921 stop:3289 length:369 start_codon:yes stop_codon:yes gene_type:complete